LDIQQLEELLSRYNAGKCTEAERNQLETWYRSFDWNHPLPDMPVTELARLKEETWSGIQKGKSATAPAETVKGHFTKYSVIAAHWRYIAAAMVIIIAGIAIYKGNDGRKKNGPADSIAAYPVITDINPGASKAQLIMAGGKVVTLDAAGSGILKEADGTRIDQQSGKLVYSGIPANGETVLYNTLSIPRGGEYQLVLPDGTRVWLNASTSLRFPTRFTGKERKIFLKGEAYFEVKEDPKMPFHIEAGNETNVEVLGTHFNIMSYDDENDTKTTLVEGKVKVTCQANTLTLSPATQAIWNKRRGSLTSAEADVEKIIAWKNGMIEFHDDDLPYIMRQLSRWYDVDISFAGAPPVGLYTGSIRRQVKLEKVLEILQLAGVQFRMDGRKIIVEESK
jgi:transmembrane sensor